MPILTNCYNITNNGLKYLSKLYKLVKLNLSSCIKITDDGLLSLSKLSNLHTLDLT